MHWFLNWQPGETGRNPLAKLKHTVLNNPTMSGEQIKLSLIRDNKSDTIPEIRSLPKGRM